MPVTRTILATRLLCSSTPDAVFSTPQSWGEQAIRIQTTPDSSLEATAPVISTTGPRRIAFLFIVLAATAVVAPMLFLGNASGHDFEFHLSSWLDVAAQWHQGIAYPRWAEWANWGFGEPRFIFYPPASWMLGAALGSALPWRMAPGAFIWLVLIFSGVSMWRLAREWLPGGQAIAAAVLFTVNPYQLVVVYYRSDFAELLASAFFPLLILGTLRVTEGSGADGKREGVRSGWQAVPFLAMIFAAVWLSNAPAAVIATYSLVLLLAVSCILQRSFLPMIRGGAAMTLGFGLAAFYILPAAYEQRWVQIAQAVVRDLRPVENFLFTHSENPEFLIFNWKVSGVALGMILIAGIAAVFSARFRSEYLVLWWMLLAVAAVTVILLFPPSALLWRYLPELRFVQFPWRWLIPLGVAYAFFIASAIGRSRRPWAWHLAFALLIAATGTTIASDAWWDSDDIPTLVAAIRTDHGYEGTDEYAPLGCDRYSLPGAKWQPDSPDSFDDIPVTPRVAKLDAASHRIVPLSGEQIGIHQWTAENRNFGIESARPVALAPRLLNYPAWDISVDGVSTNPVVQPQSARILVRVAAGHQQLEAHFHRTRDRSAGIAISCLAGVLLLVLAVRNRKPAQSL